MNLPRNMIVPLIRSNVKGTTIVSIEIRTEPKMNKTNNPYFDNVYKYQTLNGMMGFDYEGGVNRIAAKEGKPEREAKPRTWGTLTDDRLFIENNGEYYIRLQVVRSIDPLYTTKDGQGISKNLLIPFLPVKHVSSTQEDLTKELIVRNIKIENILILRFKGEEYLIIDSISDVPAETEKTQIPVTI